MKILRSTGLAALGLGAWMSSAATGQVSGDFNGDGFADLAVGVHFESIDDIFRAGAVNVIYGSAAGLTAAGDQFWHQDSLGISNNAEDGDEFGWTLAVGDFDGDGFDDLAIGAAFEGIGVFAEAGAVNVLYGSSAGLNASGNQFWHQDSIGVSNNAEADDEFGWSLAAGDFDGDGFADLAIGVPGEDIGAFANAGAVNILYGSSTGLSASGNQFWHQDSTGVNNNAEAGDQFGWSLAAGDFDGDGFTDLAIGVFGEGIGAFNSAGAVNVLYGSSSGLTASGNQFWHQDSPGVSNNAEAFDNFGYSVAAGDFDGDGFADLAVGVAAEDIGTFNSAGAVNVLYGSASGLSASGNQFWHQNSSGIAGVAEANDVFGESLGAGDFDADGFADLAIGAPEDAVPIAASQVITKITIRLNNFTHTFPDDVDILLVGPTGANAIIMSDVGGSGDATNLTITLDDAAATSLPDAGPLSGGTFRPTNIGAGDAFPAPAPAPSGGSALSVFNGTNPTGAWSLYVVDDAGGDLGTIASWQLTIETINLSTGGAITIPNSGAASPYPSTVTVNSVQFAGSVNVLYGSSTRLRTSRSQWWHQNVLSILDVAEFGDSFGGNND